MAKKEDIGDILNHDIQKDCTCSWCKLYWKSHGQTTRSEDIVRGVDLKYQNFQRQKQMSLFKVTYVMFTL